MLEISQMTYFTSHRYFWVQLVRSFVIKIRPMENYSFRFLAIRVVLNSKPFVVLLAYIGLFLELGSGSKTYFKPTHIGHQLWFWKYSPIFLFLNLSHLGPSRHFLANKNIFHYGRGKFHYFFYLPIGSF